MKIPVSILSVLSVVAMVRPAPLHAQTERRDTIRAAVVSAERLRREAGNRLVKPADYLHMTAATGEGDIVKYVQTLPGVSTGAEGSSAMYVRGGNLGGNIITIDGVPVYGSSHLLGFTSVYSPLIVSDAVFQIGGYNSEEGNFTASHIGIVTKDGSMDTVSGSVSASNFVLGGSVSMPIVRDKVSFIGALRVSPAGAEIGMVKSLTSALDSLSGIKAAIYDAYGKVKWDIDRKQSASLSLFSSLDSYGYRYGGDSDERIRWGNLIANARHTIELAQDRTLTSSISYNRFSSYQAMRKILGGATNDLAVMSSLNELTAQSMIKDVWFRKAAVQGGVKLRYARFAPGSSSSFKNGVFVPVSSPVKEDVTRTLLSTVHGQLEWTEPERLLLRAAGRANLFSSWRPEDHSYNKMYFTPEASLLARVNISRWMGVEATADWTAQHYHTLEGIPLGWSIDPLVASDATCPPEKAVQYYAGLFLSADAHHASVGAYYKEMDNLVYFADATQLFSSAKAGWRDNFKTGSGTSYGIEFLYELDTDKLDGRIAYTLSKTDRVFAEINGGLPFPAKYDRRHILNVTGEYVLSWTERREYGVSTLFTYQSGHWATMAAGEYTGTLPLDLGETVVQYHVSENNWQAPAYIRWDLGFFMRYGMCGKHPGSLNAGIYNVLNRHNVYSITYDPADRQWKQLSIFPIMPSLSWTMEF